MVLADNFGVVCAGTRGSQFIMSAAVDTINATTLSGSKEMSLEEPKMTREDGRKKKELEEQRKLGNVPAEVDEEGKDINPHIPQPTLKHQRPQPEKQKQFSSSGEWYKRGVKGNSITTNYRKGAYENCRAMTQKKKDCFERPRRVGAKLTGTNIAPDEHIQPQLMFDYDGKRDRWNGYNPEEHMKIVEEYAKVDLATRTLKAQKLQEELASGKLVGQKVYYYIRGKQIRK
uniref:Pre-mRNA-splicing factor SLU7 n=1 Tax=Peromyscus maniculatus bairdii TaxID=230844 RepID=A0A8C8SZP7_PERMB